MFATSVGAVRRAGTFNSACCELFAPSFWRRLAASVTCVRQYSECRVAFTWLAPSRGLVGLVCSFRPLGSFVFLAPSVCFLVSVVFCLLRCQWFACGCNLSVFVCLSLVRSCVWRLSVVCRRVCVIWYLDFWYVGLCYVACDFVMCIFAMYVLGFVSRLCVVFKICVCGFVPLPLNGVSGSFLV